MSLADAVDGILNASLPGALPWLIVSGQPTEAQLGDLHQAGVLTVIDLRDPMEPHGCDEAAWTTRLGMRWINTPIISGALDDATMDRVLAALRGVCGTPTLLHCNSANRTGGPLLAYLLLDQHLDEAEAIDLAMRSGLRSVEVLEWATDYAQRHR